MMEQRLGAVEAAAYHDAWSDGLVDAFLGASLVWMGAAWVWISDLAPFAGLLPAALAAPVLMGRARFVEARRGYVRWTPPRERRQRHTLSGLAFAGAGLLAAALLVTLLAGRADASVGDALAPGLLAWLLALLVVGLYVVMETPRMLAYGAVLGVSGAVAAVADANPGWPLLAAGVVVMAAAGVLVARFLRETPAAT